MGNIDSYYDQIGNCRKLPEYAARKRCSKNAIAQYQDQIGVLDRYSPIHFLVGLGSGLLLGFDRIMWIIGLVAIFPLWFLYHQYAYGYATLRHRNAQMDAVLLLLGYLSTIWRIL